ncbi:hypothetical protein [Aeoliella mucimassa]|uniref:Transmembrane protein n=1 Tax=Aeoliella mucimassa TaxID=2527972 RepID=A0A518AIA1_9BACT|nr:hypothetical protein [Aeoliella mucimassa]QDU54459.1 hypothetical protein Pan181_06410 [Aeoliella mucimassa]
MSEYELPPPNVMHRPARGPRFSTLSLLLLLTITSLVLAAYFSLGRLFGMSTRDILDSGIGQFLYYIPALLVWTIGLVLAISRRHEDRQRSTLLILAFGGLIATALAVHLAQMIMIFYVSNQGAGSLSFYFMILSACSVLLNALWWILILVALFGGSRPPELPPVRRSMPEPDDTYFDDIN